MCPALQTPRPGGGGGGANQISSYLGGGLKLLFGGVETFSIN